MAERFIPMPPNRIGPPDETLPAMQLPGPSLSGHGSPEGVVIAGPGKKYVDVDNDNLWIKAVGVQEVGWRLRGVAFTSGGTSAAGRQIVTSAVDPTGVVIITGPGECIGIDGTGAPDGRVWLKSSAGLDSDWTKILG